MPFFSFYRKLILLAGWVALGYLTYRVFQFDYEYANFDPYDILGVKMVRDFINCLNALLFRCILS